MRGDQGAEEEEVLDVGREQIGEQREQIEEEEEEEERKWLGG